MRSRWFPVIVALSVVAACGSEPAVRSGDAAPSGPAPATSPPGTTAVATPTTGAGPTTEPATTPTTTVPASTVPATGPRFEFDPDKPVKLYDAFLAAAINDIQDWWRAELPRVYEREYRELRGGVLAAYPGMPPGPTGCDVTRGTYEEYRALEAFYCPENDLIAYDDGELFPQLDDEIGRFSLALVMAHEWGHAVQQRASVDGPTILLEQQADCFAGAWVRHVADGGAPAVRFEADDLNVSLAGLIAVADAPGVESTNPQAHGSAFDRVGAFQEGWFGGPERCRDFATDAPPTIQLPFTRDDFVTQGNAPYADVVDLVTTALQQMWTSQLGSLGVSFTPPTLDVGADDTAARCRAVPRHALLAAFYCPASNTVVASDAQLQRYYRRFGDYAVGLLLADAYSAAVLQTLGSTATGETRALAADCLTGAWTSTLLPDPATAKEVTISAGDLDEAVQTLISIGDPEPGTDERGYPFEKIDAFRKGVLGGYDACVSLVQG